VKRGPIITRYGLAWLAAALVVCATVAWALFLRPGSRGSPVPLDEIKLEASETDSGSEKEQSIDEQAAALQLGLKDADLSITSDDGSVRMQVWFEEGEKKGAEFSIRSGAVLFAARDKPTVIIRVTDGSFRREAGRAQIKGTLTGYVSEGPQFFTAKELYWDRASEVITATQVRYVGPNFEVAGSEMTVDLITKQVEFDGPVELGV
jgi:hypothetical protein